MKRVLLVVFVFVLAFSMVACGGGTEPEEAIEDSGLVAFEGPLKFHDAGWDSLKFHNAVASKIIEEGYGIECEDVPGSSPALWLGLKNGDIDVMIENWSDNLSDYDETIEAGTVIELGTNMDDNMQGFYVPTYVIEGDPERGIEPMAPDLKTVEDLKKYADVFVDEEDPSKGRIYNSIPGWSVTEVIEAKFETYEMGESYNLFSPGSGASLAGSLSASYEKGDPWVGYYWEPTWISGQYDLTLLDEGPYSDELWNDGYRCDFKPVRVTVTVKKGLSEQLPEVSEFLGNYKLTSKQAAEALAYMNQNDATVEEAAEWFLTEYDDVWTGWVDTETENKVKESL
jgi:glycine betaine/proline transport system substrate-binding protein